MSSYSSRTNGRGRGGKPDKPKAQNAPIRTTDQTTPRPAGTNPGVNERLLFAAQVLIGYRVEVQVKSGVVYEGIFSTIQFEKSQDKPGPETHVVLKYARVVRDPTAQTSDRQAVAERPFKELIVYSNDLVQLIAKDVKLNAEDVGPVLKDEIVGFATDATIGKGHHLGLYGRDLQKWQPAEGDPSAVSLDSWDASGPGWDQFAQNHKLFGVTTTYDENLYTTTLDKAKSKITEEEAARIAREIEGAGSHNIHLLEERGLDAGDEVDEEEKYSSVVRPAPMPGPSAPIPVHAANRHRGPQEPSHYNQAGNGAASAMHIANSSHRTPENGTTHKPTDSAMQRPAAWIGERAGVAAVAGRANLQPPPPQHVPQLPHSAPHPQYQGSTQGAADTFRSPLNKVRQEMLSGKKPQNNMYGTSPGRTAASVLTSNVTAFEALDLYPGQTSMDPEVKKEFNKWKAGQQGRVGEAPAFPGDKGPRGPRTSPPPKQSEGLGAEQPGTKPHGMAFQPPPPPPSEPKPKAATDASASAADKAADGSADKPAAAAEATTPVEPPKKKPFTFNVHAKPFTLNVNAKEFVPGKAMSAPAAPPAPPAAPPPAGPAAAASGLVVPMPSPAPPSAAPPTVVPAPAPPPLSTRPASAGQGPMGRPASAGAAVSHGPRGPHGKQHELGGKHSGEEPSSMNEQRHRHAMQYAAASQHPGYGSPGSSYQQPPGVMQHGMHAMTMQQQMAQGGWPMGQWTMPMNAQYMQGPHVGSPGIVAYMPQPMMAHSPQAMAAMRGGPPMQAMSGPGQYIQMMQQMPHGRAGPGGMYGSYPAYQMQAVPGVQGMAGHMAGHMAPMHHDRTSMAPRAANPNANRDGNRGGENRDGNRGGENRDGNRRFSRDQRSSQDDRHDN